MSSLQERLAARRAQRAQERTFVLPVRGYEDIGLHARYKPLPYEELRDIDDRNRDVEGAEGDLNRYADTLLNACVELLERKDDGSYQSLGCRWSSAPAVLRDKLGLEVPDGVTARQAVFEVFNGENGGNDLFLHWTRWDFEASKTITELEDESLGESKPSAERSSREQPTASPEASTPISGESSPVAMPTT